MTWELIYLLDSFEDMSTVVVRPASGNPPPQKKSILVTLNKSCHITGLKGGIYLHWWSDRERAGIEIFGHEHYTSSLILTQMATWNTRRRGYIPQLGKWHILLEGDSSKYVKLRFWNHTGVTHPYKSTQNNKSTLGLDLVFEFSLSYVV